ncbi:MAG TPA: hypothetical protein VGO91_09650 [Pyrinomonadaceae bacterium]|jgi:hypothetical protein|nr:hypothetical protein [Pyrinomonadaceae bacterium]
MADPNSNGSSATPAVTPNAAGPTARRRSPIPLAILAALFIIVPFLTWYGTWFGRKLSDEDTGKYLMDQDNPRHVQHALSQVAERLDRKDSSVRRWYPQVVKQAGNPLTEIRLTTAWLMGKDSTAEEFHGALLGLLADREPIVRRNAALSLSLFGDARGRSELSAMLQPFTVVSTNDGDIGSILTEGSQVRAGALLARLTKQGDEMQEIRSPVPGIISKAVVGEGAKVKAGEALLVLSPDAESVWESLRGLLLVGQVEDLPLVEKYAEGEAMMPLKVKEQAVQTALAIKDRQKNMPAPAPPG